MGIDEFDKNIIKEFETRDLSINKEFRSIFNEIGFNEFWNNGSMAPVQAKLKNGELLDFVILQYSKYAPLYKYSTKKPKVIFIDDVESIYPSKYALSREVRNQAEKAEEKAMGFFPTVLEDDHGNKVLINGTALFFNYKNIFGSDLKVSNEEWNRQGTYIKDLTESIQTIIIAREY